MYDWNLGTWFLVLVKSAVIMASLIWMFRSFRWAAMAPPGNRWRRFIHGEEQRFPPLFSVVLTLVFIAWAINASGAESNCYRDWDGYSNPYACD